MIEFDSFNFDWQTIDGNKRNLVITIKGVDEWPQNQKEYFEEQLQGVIKSVLNAGA